jgi:hypothetical protein
MQSTSYATFDDVLSRAIDDFIQHGYDSEQRLTNWIALLRMAMAHEAAGPAEQRLEAALRTVYGRLVDRGGLLKNHPGVARWTVEQLKPRLRAALDRQILSNLSLIRLNREEASAATLRRFAGWASSVPPGGTDAPVRRAAKAQGRKIVAHDKYVLRRLAIDQGQKLTAAINEIVAKDAGALALIWHRHYTRYPREEHKERDGKVYLIKGSWAHERGLVKPGEDGYIDDITKPGEEILCRCTGEYLYSLRSLPSDLLTAKGREELAKVRKVA